MILRLQVLVLVLMSVQGAIGQRVPVLPPEMDPKYQSESEKIEAASRNIKNLAVRTVHDRLPANVQAMYRKPSKKDLEVLKPSQIVLDAYAEFLKLPDTGIFKLNSDVRCAQNTEVVNVDENCSKYKIPGGGTAYSFRFNSHRILRLSDLILLKDVIKSDGALQQGIMTDLGDIPIQNVDLATPGLKYLVSFKPAGDKNEMEMMDRQLVAGIESDGFVYSIGFYAKLKRTFVLRSIAFRGSLTRTQNGAPYDELLFDKRQDILVVFRVLDIDSEGNVTIVWKALSRRDSPRLKS